MSDTENLNEDADSGLLQPSLVRPLRKGEVSLKPTDGHADVRNDGDACFGHSGVDWCEACGAGYGTPEWKAGCVEQNYEPLSTCCGEPPLGEIEHGICRGCRDHCEFDGTNSEIIRGIPSDASGVLKLGGGS